MPDSSLLATLDVARRLEQAIQWHRDNQLQKASQAYEEILRAMPENADALHLSGLLAHQMGDPAQAARRITQAVALRPQAPHYHGNLAMALRDMGLMERAAEHMRLAHSLQPANAEIVANLGTVEMDLGRLDEAIRCYRMALSLSSSISGPSISGIRYNLANALSQRGVLQEAENCYQSCLRQTPDFANCHFNLGNLQNRIGQAVEAAQSFRNAIALQPDHWDSYINLGALLHKQNQFAEAIRCYADALTLEGAQNSASTNQRAALLANLGVSLAASERHADAIAAFDAALTIAPDNLTYQWDRGMSRLALGRFAEGWADHDVRLRCGLKDRGCAGELWRGQSLAGRTLLLTAEQGLGDMIWAARFLPPVKALGAYVVMESHPALHALFTEMGVADRLIVLGDPLPATDFYASICSLPGLFVGQEADIPGKAYVRAPISRIAAIDRFLERDSGKQRVGVVWSGNTAFAGNGNRRTEHFHFLEYFSLPSVQLYSLQKGAPADELSDCDRVGGQMIDLGPFLSDMADTAAAVAKMDLVITVDTAVAHLAGAMGKPVWLLLGMAPCWMWMTDRADSPWYDSMRIFRRTEAREWRDLFADAAQAFATSFPGTQPAR